MLASISTWVRLKLVFVNIHVNLTKFFILRLHAALSHRHTNPWPLLRSPNALQGVRYYFQCTYHAGPDCCGRLRRTSARSLEIVVLVTADITREVVATCSGAGRIQRRHANQLGGSTALSQQAGMCLVYHWKSDHSSKLMKFVYDFCFAGATSGDHRAAAVPTTERHPCASRLSAAAAQSHTRSERDVRADHHTSSGIGLGYTLRSDLFRFRVQLSQYFPQETEAHVKEKLFHKRTQFFVKEK